MRPLFHALALVLLLAFSACKRHYGVGDEVLVQWEDDVYPAKIIEAVGTTKYKVHYDGYDTVWDEVVTRDRVKGLVEGTPVHPEPPAKVRAKALQSAKTNVHKVGDRLRVEFHGHVYQATVIGIVGQERYRVHYDGYGPEWDETVGLDRIQAR